MDGASLTFFRFTYFPRRVLSSSRYHSSVATFSLLLVHATQRNLLLYCLPRITERVSSVLYSCPRFFFCLIPQLALKHMRGKSASRKAMTEKKQKERQLLSQHNNKHMRHDVSGALGCEATTDLNTIDFLFSPKGFVSVHFAALSLVFQFFCCCSLSTTRCRYLSLHFSLGSRFFTRISQRGSKKEALRFPLRAGIHKHSCQASPYTPLTLHHSP